VAKSNLIARNLVSLVEPKSTRFVTLTLRHSTDSLTVQVNRLYSGFARLRARKLWRSTQRGGIAFLEVNWSADTQRWHPHLHVITTGGFIPQAKLRQAWHSITGDSYVVDVRWVRSSSNAASYVAKYAAKGAGDSVARDPAAFAEAISALRGRRTFLTYGTWRGVVLSKPTDLEPHDWQPVCSLERLLERAQSGDHRAAEMVACLAMSIAVVDDSPPRGSPLPPIAPDGEPLSRQLPLFTDSP
jgi:hypothetical protein